MAGRTNYENEIVHKVELYWYTHQRYPTSAQIAKELNAQVSDVEDAIRHNPKVKRQLKLRGVDRVLLTGDSIPVELDPVRLSVALEISSIHGDSKINERLEQLGITETQFRGWQQDPLFMNFLRMRTLALVSEEMPQINRSMLRKAGNGDSRATKLVMELTGQIASGTTIKVNAFNSGQDPMFIVKKLVEVIRRHVQDPETISLIARDFDEALNSNEPLENVIAAQAVPRAIQSATAAEGGYRF